MPSGRLTRQVSTPRPTKTPTPAGSSPPSATRDAAAGAKGAVPLAALSDENDKGFALINALDASPLKQAVLNYQVSDLVLGPGADGQVIQLEGMASALNASQQVRRLRSADSLPRTRGRP